MASSSTSSIHKTNFKYDVFLSFRGEDTRKNFIDHLYFALERKGVHTYKDDERIKKGKKISDELIKSIEDSRFYIIVFSKTYASSSWCLDELVKIMECQKTTEQTAYPVFYDVEPTEVRKQSGEFGQAFAKHEREEAAEKWREALEEAAALAGWELKNTADGHEAKFIQKIVEEISLESRSINFNNDGKLIGMESRIKDVLSSLEMGFHDVHMIGIKGIGGGGKTTLARAVFDHISTWFEGKSFVENVREVSKSSLSGLKSLQKQVLSDVLNEQGIKVSSVDDGKKLMKKMMCGRKVLLVLDDVDHTDQLEALAGEPNWFKSGSRIIITTRDEQVLVAHRVNVIHDVNLLSHEEAICLFSRYAFGREVPIQGHEELSKQVVRYAAGLPLTIRVLGSFLCGKNELEWKDALERLKKIPLKETLEKLELSYISLEADYKEIFLDVACMLKGWRKEKAIRVLESCGFYARNGLRVLQQKSLITISKYGDLCMHDHIEEMGRNIVRRLHPDEPNKHSRLWIKEEIDDILANDLGTEATRYINIFSSKRFYPKIVINVLGKMKKLIYLNGDFGSYPNSFPGFRSDEISLPNSLRYLCWRNYPFWSLPKTFQANNLVALEICHSKILQLWEGGERKVLNKLRFLDLSYSTVKTLDLGLTPNLETLSLKDCSHLVELHMPVKSPKLISFDIKCYRLRTLNLGLTPNLEILRLDGCGDLAELYMPVGCQKLKSLDLYHHEEQKTPLYLGHTSNLETINLGRYDLVELRMPVEFPKLTSLDLSYSKLRTLDLGQTPNLETLFLVGCVDLVELHIPFECLKLKSIYIRNSSLRTLDLRRTQNLERLQLEKCVKFVELHMPFDRRRMPVSLQRCDDLVEFHNPVECLKLKLLSLSHLKLKTLDLRLTPNLVTLDINRCDDLVEVHMPIGSLELSFLKIMGSKLRTFDLGWTPNLEELRLTECVDLVEVHMPVECLKLKYLVFELSKLRTLDLGGTPNLVKLVLENCYDLVKLHIPVECLNLYTVVLKHTKLRALDLGLTPNLNWLQLIKCYHLVELHIRGRSLINLECLGLSGCLGFKFFEILQRRRSIQLTAVSLDTCPLNSDNNLRKFRSTCSFEEHVASSVGNLENNFMGLCAYTNLKNVVKSICRLQFLTKLTLNGSFPEASKDLDQVECLENLSFLSTECLEELSFSSTEIKHLPDSICVLKHLKSLDLNCCRLLEILPEDLDRLECLETLILSNCISLRDIPDNISKMKRLKSLFLRSCIQVEKLPEEFGCLESLKELDIEGTRISHLPQSIFLLKGLRIVGSRWLLHWCGLASKIQTSNHKTFCYI